MGAKMTRLVAGPVMSRNLRHPDGLAGRLVLRKLTNLNRVLEEATVKLCQIQPSYQVLEVGYGHGVGLKAVYPLIKDGPGIVHGIDMSETAYNITKENVKKEISQGKVQVHLCSITQMSFEPNYFDCIFHSNCFYFWDEMDPEVRALHQVLKPDGLMVATMNLDLLEMITKKGFMQFGNTDPDRYMTSLEQNGFKNIRMDTMKDEKSGLKYQAIFATAQK